MDFLIEKVSTMNHGDVLTTFSTKGQLVDVKIGLIKLQNALTLDNVTQGRCLFQYKDPELVTKIICAIIAQFNASVNVSTEKMDAADIYECATLLQAYTHDRVEDIILCLRMSMQGKFGKIYNRVDTLIIMEFWNQYLDIKYQHQEYSYKAQKGSDYRTEADTQLINNERKYESALDKAHRLAVQQRQEIVSLKTVLEQSNHERRAKRNIKEVS